MSSQFKKLQAAAEANAEEKQYQALMVEYAGRWVKASNIERAALRDTVLALTSEGVAPPPISKTKEPDGDSITEYSFSLAGTATDNVVIVMGSNTGLMQAVTSRQLAIANTIPYNNGPTNVLPEQALMLNAAIQVRRIPMENIKLRVQTNRTDFGNKVLYMWYYDGEELRSKKVSIFADVNLYGNIKNVVDLVFPFDLAGDVVWTLQADKTNGFPAPETLNLNFKIRGIPPFGC